MTVTIEYLTHVVHQYFPRGHIVEVAGIGRCVELLNRPALPGSEMPAEAWPPPGYEDTDEHLRLIATRKQAGANKAVWDNVLARISKQLPNCSMMNYSLHLPTGAHDSGYVAAISLPDRSFAERRHELRFAVSVLAPVFAFASSFTVYPPGFQESSFDDDEEDDSDEFSSEVLYIAGPPNPLPPQPIRHLSFDLRPDEQSFAQAVMEVLHAVFPGYERLSSEIGCESLPDVVTDFKPIGEATLYDLLFTNDW